MICNPEYHQSSEALAHEGIGVPEKLRRLAKRQGLTIEVVSDHGKGSHVRVYLGAAFVTLKDRKKEISPGLLHDMCRQLGIDAKDL